jgi:hypothetical protein
VLCDYCTDEFRAKSPKPYTKSFNTHPHIQKVLILILSDVSYVCDSFFSARGSNGNHPRAIYKNTTTISTTTI